MLNPVFGGALGVLETKQVIDSGDEGGHFSLGPVEKIGTGGKETFFCGIAMKSLIGTQVHVSLHFGLLRSVENMVFSANGGPKEDCFK